MEQSNGNREIAIQISGIKKQYRLGQIGGGTLQADLQSWWARVRGKEDPNIKIGQEQRLVGQTFMALNGIDLTVYKGEALGIIGKNGAGKSTLLKLLTRVTAPTDGTIDLYGRVASMLEVGTGFNGEMTGRENIYMNGAILGMTKAEIDAKMEDIIEFSEVRDFIDTPVKRYSSGMYVKLAFSVAAHLDSEIMIMDEVLAVGDMAFQKKCLTKMREAANQDGRTVLYVSHNMNTIRQLCDRCVVLDQGRVIFDGDVEQAISRYMGYDGSSLNNILITPEMRDPHYLYPKVTFKRIVIDSSDGILSFGSKLGIKLTYNSISDEREEVYIRIMVKKSSGEPVTMTATKKATVINPGDSIEQSYLINISNITPGAYTLSFVIYEVGELGVDRNIDVIRDRYSFAIVSTDDFNHGMSWNSLWWGDFTNGYLEEQ